MGADITFGLESRMIYNCNRDVNIISIRIETISLIDRNAVGP